MTFNSVAEVNAYYAAIPPLDISAELKACDGDGLAMANVAIRSLGEYMSKYSVPMEWPTEPPKRRRWWNR